MWRVLQRKCSPCLLSRSAMLLLGLWAIVLGKFFSGCWTWDSSCSGSWVEDIRNRSLGYKKVLWVWCRFAGQLVSYWICRHCGQSKEGPSNLWEEREEWWLEVKSPEKVVVGTKREIIWYLGDMRARSGKVFHRSWWHQLRLFRSVADLVLGSHGLCSIGSRTCSSVLSMRGLPHSTMLIGILFFEEVESLHLDFN